LYCLVNFRRAVPIGFLLGQVIPAGSLSTEVQGVHTAWITAGGPGIAPAPLMLGHHEFTPSRRNRARGGGPVIPARAPGPGGLAQHGRDLPHATSAAPGIRKMTVFPSGCQC